MDRKREMVLYWRDVQEVKMTPFVSNLRANTDVVKFTLNDKVSPNFVNIFIR
jgi:hypothetical protein